MNLAESILTCFRKYIVFSGRAQRSEYWWFFLFTFVISVVLGILAIFASALRFLEWVFFLAVLLPSLAVTARRLHDTNRTGWWMLMLIGLGLAGIIAGAVVGAIIYHDEEWGPLLVFLVSIAGGLLGWVAGYLVLLYFLIQPSNPGANQYGPNPLQPQQGTGGYGYHQAPGHPYSPAPPTGSYGESTYDTGLPDSVSEPEPGERRFCTQCGMQLQPAARFCTVCGAAV